MAGIDTPAGYTRLERTGTGADAGVYRAWDERAGRWVVLRLFHRFLSGRSEEAAFAAHVTSCIGLGRNTSIVPVRAGGITATGRPWMALDPIEARPFSEILRDDPPPATAAMDLTIVLADTLAWSHTTRPAMVHGRIRAESVLVRADGVPMLTDFAAPRPPGTPAPTPSGDVTDLAALLFRAVTGGPWPGRGDEDELLISGWPGLTALFDEVLTPVPAIESMAVFADRLRQVRHGAGGLLGSPGAVSLAPKVAAAPALPVVAVTAPVVETEQAPVRGRHLPALAAVLVLVPIGFGVVQLFPGRTGEAAEPSVPVSPAACAPPTPTPEPAASDPALWWPADEGDGPTVCDHSGGGNQATLSPEAGWSTTGAAMRFGAGSGFASGSAPAVRTDRSFTVMAWVKLGNTDRTHGVLSQPGTTSSGFILKYEKGSDTWRLTLPRTDSGAPVVDGPSSSSRPQPGAWTHLAATFDADRREATLYVDGVAEGTAEHAVAWDATGPVQVARSWWDGAWTDRFDGLIDDVRAYRVQLSAQGITEIADAGRADHPH